MDEKMIGQLMRNLDNDLLLQELDEIMADIDIDVDSITQKAHWKLRKEQYNMKKHKKKTMALVVVCLVAVCGVMTVYGADISNFIQSLIGKTGVYGTVVDGQTYYLAEPVALHDGNRLNQAMFDNKTLHIQLEMASEGLPDVKIRIANVEMEPRGMEGYNNLYFYEVEPTSLFELILDGKIYPIQLSTSQSIVGDSEIVEAEPNHIQWISMGYKKIKDGIQLLAATDDPSVKIVFFKTPRKDTVKQTSNNQGIGNSTGEEFLPMLGYDQDGAAYEFQDDPSDMGRPLTKFTTDAPAGKELTITLPGIVVATEKSVEIKVAVPAEKDKVDIPQTIDLGLQKMQLESIERTSDTTARLQFALNTGGQEDVRIWDTNLDCASAVSTESLWENGTCVLDVTFPSGTSELQLGIANPMFIIDGNWIINLK